MLTSILRHHAYLVILILDISADINDFLPGGEHQKGDLSVPPKRRLSNDPRTCDECGRTFKYPSDLKKHLQIHTGRFLISCSFVFSALQCVATLALEVALHTIDRQ